MNPYANYTQPYSVESPYSWYQPYCYSTQNYFSGFGSNAYNFFPQNCFSSQQEKNTIQSHTQTVKVEVENHSSVENSNGESKTQLNKKEAKELNNKTVLSKVQIGNKNTFLHTPKSVNH
jgi:hypothetical protein